MTGQHHAICGAALSAPAMLALAHGSVGAVLVTLPIAAVAAMLPDVDTRNFPLRGQIYRFWERFAKAARRRGIWGEPFALAAFVVGFVMGGLIGGVSWVIRRFVKHRGATHTFLCAAIIGTAAVWASMAWFASWVPGAALAIGYVSHLLTDALTLRGVELLDPVSQITFHLLPRPLRFATGSGGESVAVLLILVGALFGFAAVYTGVIVHL